MHLHGHRSFAIDPVGVAATTHRSRFIFTIGKNLGLIGFTILAMQFVLSARVKWIERPFGMDVLFGFHKAMAILSLILLIAHPALLAIDGGGWSLLLNTQIMWDIWLGRIALIFLLGHILLASFRRILKLEYERWRFIHNVGAVLVLGLGFVHSWFAGGDLQIIWMQAIWVALLVVAVASYLWHRFVRPQLLRRQRYTVTRMQKEAKGVWTIEMTPPDGINRFDYLPGQFHYLTFLRAPELPVEEHPWTISSSPTEAGVLRSTIKESGDFTAFIGKTKPGDTAIVNGPFGRFSYVLHPDQRELVFIAGGVGITPLMSMLRHIRDTGEDKTVTLIYANSNEDSIVFSDELAQMEREGVAGLKVVHVLSKPSDEWQGERGRIDEEKIKRLLGPDLSRFGFYVCAPPGLINDTAGTLRARASGVSPTHIHFERFSL